MKSLKLTTLLCLAVSAPLCGWQLSNEQTPESVDGVYQIEPGNYEVLAQSGFAESGESSFHVFLPPQGEVLVSVSESHSILMYLDDTNAVHLLSVNESGEFEEVASWGEDGDRWVRVTVDTTNAAGKISVESEWTYETAFAESLAVTGNSVFYLTDLVGEAALETVAENSLQAVGLTLDASQMEWTRGRASIDFTGAENEGRVKPPSVLDPGSQPGGRFTKLIERPIKRKAILSTPASASFNVPEEK